MGLSLRQIEVIRAVLRAGTLTHAARQLGVSQPGISRVLRNAEDRLGMELFERRAGRLHPTPEALALYPEIEKVYAEIDSIQRAAEDLRSLRGGRLSVVSIPSIATTILAGAIGRLTAAHPDLRITLRTVLNYEVLENLRTGAAEIGFAFDMPDNPAVVATEIGTAQLVCIVPKGHRLASYGTISARDLDEEPLVSFSRTLAIGAAVESAFAEMGATRRIAIEVGQSFLACALVKAGAGVAVIDDLGIGEIPRGLLVKPFRPKHAVRLHALFRQDRLSLPAQALMAILLSHGRTRSSKRKPAT